MYLRNAFVAATAITFLEDTSSWTNTSLNKFTLCVTPLSPILLLFPLSVIWKILFFYFPLRYKAILSDAISAVEIGWWHKAVILDLN